MYHRHDYCLANCTGLIAGSKLSWVWLLDLLFHFLLSGLCWSSKTPWTPLLLPQKKTLLHYGEFFYLLVWVLGPLSNTAVYELVMWGYRSKEFRLSSSLKCQSLLHMAMFRHKQKTAIKYSKTLTDHFSVRCRDHRNDVYYCSMDVNALLYNTFQNAAQRTQRSPLVLTPK